MATTYEDDRTEVRGRRGRDDERDVTDWARGLPSERPPRGFLDRRRWVETKWSFKTTELLTILIVGVGLLVTALVNDDFGANDAWRFGTAAAIGYMVARGIAKAGKGT